MRPMMSAPPPGPNDTMMRIGFCGQSCALVDGARLPASIKVIAARIDFFISSSLSFRDGLRSAAPDFFYDGAVIEIGLAGTYAGLKHIRIHAEHRKLLPDSGRLIEHQMHVFQSLFHTAFGGKIAAHH